MVLCFFGIGILGLVQVTFNARTRGVSSDLVPKLALPKLVLVLPSSSQNQFLSLPKLVPVLLGSRT